MEYRIITDGSCDLPSDLTKEKNIIVVPFYVSFDGENYQKELVEMPIRKFYEEMVENPKVYPKSSMPSVQDYVDVFLPVVKENKAIICICITTKFSGSMQSALNARNMVLENYPNAQITVIDATVNTVLQGLYVLEAAEMQQNGVSYEKAVKELEKIKSTGRIGKLAGLAGSVLGIRPIITLEKGEIFPSGIARTRKKSLERVMNLLLQYLREYQVDCSMYSLAVGYGYDREEGLKFRERALEALYANGYSVTEEQLPVYQIGATIGVHTGPHPLGFGIIQRNRYHNK